MALFELDRKDLRRLIFSCKVSYGAIQAAFTEVTNGGNGFEPITVEQLYKVYQILKKQANELD